MKKTERFFPLETSDLKLHGYTWEPDSGEIRGVVQLVHGMAEYIGRYNDFAEYLTTCGFAVIGHDHRGHGQSITSLDDLGYFAAENGSKILLDDIHLVAQYGAHQWPDQPRFILGHSMGSFLVRRYITLYSDELDGAVIMGTGNVPKGTAALGKRMASVICASRGDHHLSRVLTGMTLGSYNKAFKPNRTPVDWLSRNEENCDRYMEDPFCGFEFTAGAYKDFFTILQEVAGNVDANSIRKTFPILIISGELDPVGGKDACIDVAKQYRYMGLEDVELKLYRDDRHEILNEVDREQVFRDLGDWFIQKLPA